MNSGYVLRLKVKISAKLLMLLIYLYQTTHINAKGNPPNPYTFLLIFQRNREIISQKGYFKRIKAVFCGDYVFLRKKPLRSGGREKARYPQELECFGNVLIISYLVCLVKTSGLNPCSQHRSSILRPQNPLRATLGGICGLT
jgi:hypothetical protein